MLEQPRNETPWTVGRGLLRATLAGTVVSVVLAVPMGFLAGYLPTVVFHLFLRFFISFGVCWLLIQVVQRFGGATGWPFTTLAVVFALAVMFSNFIALIIHAPIPPTASPHTGTGPFMFAVLNLASLVGILMAVYVSAGD